jgi:(2R)-sulfolactate sulfo-lyase subunit alpha
MGLAQSWLIAACARSPTDRTVAEFARGQRDSLELVREGGIDVSKTDFLVHAVSDTVGVVVVENAAAGRELSGWIMETDETITIEAVEEIPLGHKLALNEIKKGDTVIKYGHDIGRATGDIPRGRHVHVHNLKTKRW